MVKDDTIQVGHNPQIIIASKTFSLQLFYVAVVLFILNMAGIFLDKIVQSDTFFTNTLVYFFDASQEGNIPTLFATLILFVASVLLFLIYCMPGKGSGGRIYWLALTIVFIFLTIDEAAMVHEQFNRWRSLTGDQSGYFHYSWIIPYAVILLVAGIFFFRFLLSLPAKTRRLFMLSGSIFVTAAIGFELLEGRVISLYGPDNLYDKLLCAVEEFMEMTGIILFIYALTDYLMTFWPILQLRSKK